MGLIIVVVVTLAAFAAPFLTPHDPLAITGGRLEPSSSSHPLGTDALGRDMLSRLLFGARLSLGSAFLASSLVMAIAVVWEPSPVTTGVCSTRS